VIDLDQAVPQSDAGASIADDESASAAQA